MTELIDELIAVLQDAQEELRLLRMNDMATVYDPTLRFRISAVLERAGGEDR